MLRNREFQRFSVYFFLIAAVSVTLGFRLNTAAGLLSTASAIAFGAAFFMFTKVRYQSIADISHQIDLVLHNADILCIGESDEGELSILQSEITKMMLRIREQNDSLKREKEHLADSLADIAHQLRTPLTSVNLILSLLEKNPDKNEQRGLIREIEALFVQMDWLLTSLLKLSRLDAGIVVFQSEPVQVENLVHDALRTLLIPMELHNITVQKDIPKAISICGDPSWLSEALQNILKNCIDSVGENGTIEISCTDNPLFTEITIHDSGKGFDKSDLPRLFDRYYRGKSDMASGYGIGLALCKMIITRQGGSVTAKNHTQGGAAFVIRFPK